MEETFTQPIAQSAEIVSRQCKLGLAARAELGREETPAQYLQRLIHAGLYADGIVFLAHWMSKRQALWWGCLSVWWRRRHLDVQSEAALQAVVAWLREPTEPHRRAAEAAALDVGLDNAAGCLAMATVYCQGSMTPAGLPEVPPPPALAHQQIANALQLLSLEGPPAEQPYRLRQMLQIGLDVKQGTNLIPSPEDCD